MQTDRVTSCPPWSKHDDNCLVSLGAVTSIFTPFTNPQRRVNLTSISAQGCRRGGCQSWNRLRHEGFSTENGKLAINYFLLTTLNFTQLVEFLNHVLVILVAFLHQTGTTMIVLLRTF
jgi:hypothetical protein